MSSNSKGDGGRRVARVEREVQAVIANFLISGLKSELPGLVSVSRVIMPSDLKSAKVYITLLLPSDLESKHEEFVEETLDTLQRAAVAAQQRISKELALRYCPKLTFYYDDTTQNILKVEKILADIGKEQSSKSVATSVQDED